MVCCPGDTAGGFAPKKVITGAVGAATMMLFDFVFEPLALDAVRVTLNVPADAYTCVGFLDAEVAPSPKLHDHDVGPPVDVSVNVTWPPATGEAGEYEKSATGAPVAPVNVYLFSNV